MKKRIALSVFLLFPLFLMTTGMSFPFDPENIVIVATLATIFAGVGTWFIWNAKVSFDALPHIRATDEEANQQHETNVEKRKRDTLDNVLRDLSDEQLAMLRRRLEDNTIDDEILHERIVGADGELIHRR